jgi:DNA-binding transcriptional LysR family regulator
MDWNDLRYVLAVAEAGSALRAAERLGVNQTTVLRRIDALEAQLGTAFFERRRSGHSLTPAGRRAVEAAERMDAEVGALVSALAAERRNLAGLVRITTSESLANRLVTPSMRAFHERHPGIDVELITSDQRLDLARGDADVALRAGSRPEGAGIVARRLPDHHWTIYCSRKYAAQRGYPRTREEIGSHDIVGMDGRIGHPARLPMAGFGGAGRADPVPLQQPHQPGVEPEGGPGPGRPALHAGRRRARPHALHGAAAGTLFGDVADRARRGEEPAARPGAGGLPL